MVGTRSTSRTRFRWNARSSFRVSTRMPALVMPPSKSRSVQSLAALRPAARRGALAGVTGHVAESVTEVVLEAVGWTPVWHFAGPGRHGVDLPFLGPGEERLFAVEVKGTLRPHHWPRMRRGELTQMDLAWLDKADNPAMSEWGVTSDYVYGAIAPCQLRRAQVQDRADTRLCDVASD
jgi:hypothetical protein